MKPPITETQVRGKRKWRLNLKKSLTGDCRYRRRFFNSERAAVKYYNRVLRDIKAHGAEFAELSEVEQAALGKLYKLIQSKGLTIETIAQLVEQHGENPSPATGAKAQLTISTAIDLFYRECEEAELTTTTMREYRSQLDRFRKSFGEQPLSALNKQMLKDWIKTIKVRGKTKNNYITTLGTFCEHWFREEILDKNFGQLLKKVRVYAKTPVILSVEDIVKFANYIRVHEPAMIAPLAIAIFAGVRTCELEGLLWADIDFVKRQIHIRLAISKKPCQRERWIKMSDNLVAWLSVCKDRTGKILKYPTMDNFWDRRSMAFEKATGKKWPRNGARKSFASAHWAVGGDVKETSKEMGNTPQVAKRFYIAEGEEEKGRQFLQVMPEPQDRKSPVRDAKTDSSPGGTEKIEE